MPGHEARLFRWSAASIVLFTGLFVAWLVIRPADHDLFVTVDNLGQCAGMLLAILLCLLAVAPTGRTVLTARARSVGATGMRGWAPILFALGMASYLVGQGIWTVEEDILHREVLFPSWADAGFLAEYPFLLLGVLLLAARPLPLVSRARVVLDGLMVMTGVVAFSWYFVLGPTIRQGADDPLAKALGTAYPLFDLVLIACLLLLLLPLGGPATRRGALVLATGLGVVVVTDSLFDYQQLHDAYATGTPVDLGWPLGYLLVGLGVQALRRPRGAGPAPEVGDETSTPAVQDEAPATPSLWKSLLPYALIPAVGLLLAYVSLDEEDPQLRLGVYLGAAALLGLALVRQVLALVENQHLFVELAGHARDLARLNAELRAMYSDNHSLSSTNAQLEVLATTDPLTKLPNRSLLHDRVEQAILGAQRDRQSAALLLLDLDRFKEVNDTLGHQFGDALLQQIGPRLQRALRASDTVARLGGDEFAVLLPGVDAGGAAEVATKLLESLEAPFQVEGHALFARASVGFALYPQHGEDARTLLRHADVAMYLAKRSHAGFARYTASKDQHSAQRLALMNELGGAIADGGLVLHYQPLISFKTGRVIGLEALARWPHPLYGLVPPDDFIPIAEHTGLILPLSRWVLERALGQLRQWDRGGLQLGVAVNMSGRTLHDAQLAEAIEELLRQHEILPGRLTLEITESVLMVDPPRALAVLLRLTQIGVRIAIDDFGTGYSSLGYLKRLPVHQVKIDKGFVLGLAGEEGAKDLAIVRSVLGMARALELEVVAEGVENAETWDLLRTLECDTGQGYYMSRPQPAGELTRWLQTSPWARGQAHPAAIGARPA